MRAQLTIKDNDQVEGEGGDGPDSPELEQALSFGSEKARLRQMMHAFKQDPAGEQAPQEDAQEA